MVDSTGTLPGNVHGSAGPLIRVCLLGGFRKGGIHSLCELGKGEQGTTPAVALFAFAPKTSGETRDSGCERKQMRRTVCRYFILFYLRGGADTFPSDRGEILETTLEALRPGITNI